MNLKLPKQKEKYTTPRVGVIVVALEEAIASVSGETGSSPNVDDYGTGTGSVGWSGDGDGF